MPIRHPKQFRRYLRRSIGGLERTGERSRTSLRQAFSPARAAIQELDALQTKPEKSPADHRQITEKLANLKVVMAAARVARDLSAGAQHEGHMMVINRVAVAIALQEFRSRPGPRFNSARVGHALLEILRPSVSESGRSRAAGRLVEMVGASRARALIDELTGIFEAMRPQH